MNLTSKFLLFLMMLFLSPVLADVFDYEHDLNYIVPKLPQLENTTCKFYQDKYIPSSNVHLKSSGDFKFEKEKGVTFYTTYPVKSTVSYNNSEYKQVNNIIKSIANKNYSRLQQEFSFYYTNDLNNWFLGLKPKANSKVADYILTIVISGKNQNRQGISKITIQTKDKIITNISFVK